MRTNKPTMDQHITESERSNIYSVYQVENHDKRSKHKNQKFFIVSKLKEPEAVLNMVRSMASSPTAKGGAKELGADMKAKGADYKDSYTAELIKGGLSKEKANLLKGKLIDKLGSNKVYNQSQPIN